MQVELKNENENEHFNDQLFFEVNKYDIHGTGIDFGETFCRAAINRRNGLEVISLDNAGQKFLPSCVAFDEKIAKCGQIVQNVEGFVGMFSEDALAVIFKCIKQKTEEYKAEKLEEVVISVPYNFNESQRNAVSIAAKIAEWKTVWLLQEPFAAVYGYWYLLPKTQTPGTILVIDFGGGNLNVCILRVTNKEIALLSYQNNNKVGGKMFDEILIEYFENKLKTDFQILIPGNKRFLLKKESQKIKEELSIVEKQWHVYIQ
uniref:Heat shock protein 70 n=1 Tax=Panagrolaimus sp. ES5 TaxID=591445 RepID=A0AC34F678_9BILA